jgi:hypothetical protein
MFGVNSKARFPAHGWETGLYFLAIKEDLMRYRIMTASLIVMAITTIFQISLVSATSVEWEADSNAWSQVEGAEEQKQNPRGQELQASSVPVLPGIEGFGINTPAGRGGQVIRVTTLEDNESLPGSLRHALYRTDITGPRVIVFEVGGTIQLSRVLQVKYPYVTIAGQTAPPPGITLAGDALMIATHDVLVQHLHIRTGDRGGSTSRVRNVLMGLGSHDGSQEAYNIVIDHCSLSWGTDEMVQLWYPNVYDVTVRNCIISEGLYDSIHPEGVHSFGFLIGDHSERIAVINNLLAHNGRRNPGIFGDTSSITVNNVIYNWISGGIHINDFNENGPILASVVGNVLIPGANTPDWSSPIKLEHGYLPEGTQIYLSDNVAVGRDGVVGGDTSKVVDTPPIWPDSLTVRPSGEVKDWVLANAGARPWDRDPVDERIISDVQNGTGQVINSQDDVGGWPNLTPTSHTLDLPDRPNDDDDGDGYTNLEEWLHKMSHRSFPCRVFLPFLSKE